MIIIGEKYANWTVIKETKKVNKKTYFLCLCNCGQEKEVRNDNLREQKSQFCSKCRHTLKEIQINDRFGKWTVLELVESEEKRKHYKVKCDCGFERVLKGIRLRFGDSNGCRKCGSTKHDMVHSKTYTSWESMVQRCTNTNNTNYKHYGNRGIGVDTRWLKFENFLEDMGIRPTGLELDRIDNNGNYEKNNCRWVTHQENLLNKKR